jgi:uncharacterized membrane protein (UPF0127 family)
VGSIELVVFGLDTMKKQIQQKRNGVVHAVAKNRNTVVRTGIFITLLVGLFFSSMYGFKCLATKVCESVIIDKFVRHDMIILMPNGALEVEVANTRASRELGLSGRKQMGDDEGVLFVFDAPGRYGFWMKDMQFPLDIVWINENGIVVSIERNLSPDTYPQTYMNQADASYVLEMKAGLAEKFGLYLGSKVKMTD